jgi:hypothetical protein
LGGGLEATLFLRQFKISTQQNMTDRKTGEAWLGDWGTEKGDSRKETHHNRHIDVHQNNVVSPLLESLQSLNAVTDGYYAVMVLCEKFGEYPLVYCVVICEEDGKGFGLRRLGWI